ncbi:hypothetical protein SVIOM74S_08325 [Streptomyces violarus]
MRRIANSLRCGAATFEGFERCHCVRAGAINSQSINSRTRSDTSRTTLFSPSKEHHVPPPDPPDRPSRADRRCGSGCRVGAAGSASAAPELPANPNLGGLTALDGANVGNTVDGAAQDVTRSAGDTGGKTVKKAVPAAGKIGGKTVKKTTPLAQKAAGDAAGSAGQLVGDAAGSAPGVCRRTP